MVGFRMLDYQPIRLAVQLVDLPGRSSNTIHACSPEVTVFCRGANKDRAWRDGRHHLVKVRWNRLQLAFVSCQTGHVAILTPTSSMIPVFGITAVVVGERVQSATAHHHFKSVIKNAREH